MKSGSSLKRNVHNYHKVRSKVPLISMDKKVDTGAQCYKAYMTSLFLPRMRQMFEEPECSVQFFCFRTQPCINSIDTEKTGCFLSTSLIRYSVYGELRKANVFKNFSQVADCSDSRR